MEFMYKIDKTLIEKYITKFKLPKISKFLFCKPLFSIIVTYPMILAMIYYLFIASPRYESSATIVIQQNKSIPSSFSLTSLIAGGTSDTFNAFLYIDYVKSFDMFSKLNKKISIQALYQSKKGDWLSRLPNSRPDQEKILNYYESMLRVKFNSESSGIDLSAQAFTPKDSYKIVKNIIALSQEYINDINKELVKKKLTFNEELMHEGKKKLHNAKMEIIKFQNKYNIVDPTQSVKTKIAIMNELLSLLAKYETEMITMKVRLNHNSSPIKKLQNRINGIKKQIDVEKAKILTLSGENISNEKLNYLLSQFQWLKINLEYSSQMYQSSLQAYEAEKIALNKNQVQLLVIDPPYVPDYAKYPRTLYILTSLLIILLMIFGITRMIITIINEHRY
jgi:capsular polysaccharide transport system permease protein